MFNRTLILLVITTLLFAFYVPYLEQAEAAWWDANYNNYRKITIESDYIDATLTNFPLLVVLDNSTGNFNFHNGGADIAFVSLNNITRFGHEIESFDNAGDTSESEMDTTQ